MSEFNVVQWCDFVRGVGDAKEESAMREHLASDPKAQRTVELLCRVRSVAEADDAFPIPDYALRIVKAAASVSRRPDEVPAASAWSFLPFRVAFDSFRAPALAGPRDLHASYRQVQFQTDEYSLDVRLEHSPGPEGTAVIGQILKLGDEPAPMAEIPVLVASEGRVVERSLTSRFGEFHAEDLPKSALRLYALVGEDSCIAVPLESDETD